MVYQKVFNVFAIFNSNFFINGFRAERFICIIKLIIIDLKIFFFEKEKEKELSILN